MRPFTRSGFPITDESLANRSRHVRVADQRDERRADHFVRRAERPAEYWSHAGQVERVGRDARQSQSVRAIATAHVHVPRRYAPNNLNDCWRARYASKSARNIQSCWSAGAQRVDMRDHHDAIAVTEGQAPEQRAVDDAEHRGGQSDSQRERDDAWNRDAGTARERSSRVRDVATNAARCFEPNSEATHR